MEAQLPPEKRAQLHSIFGDVYCGQTAEWIKMPVGTEVNLVPGHVVLDGDPARPKRGQPPVFGPCLLLPIGWMDKTPLGTEVDLGPGHIVLDGDPALPTKGAQQPPLFDPCTVTTVAHLSYC